MVGCVRAFSEPKYGCSTETLRFRSELAPIVIRIEANAALAGIQRLYQIPTLLTMVKL